MVAYNFQPEFGAAILAGVKTSTIRPNGRRRHARVGEVVQLYSGMRTPYCTLLARAICIGAYPVEVLQEGVRIDGAVICDSAALDALAISEGFSKFGNMQAWFDIRYSLPVFNMTQILWRPDAADEGANGALVGAS